MFKDARMSEQAHLIQIEVGKMTADIKRLDDRVLNLQKHFALSNKDIDDILTSTRKITRTSQKINETDLTPHLSGSSSSNTPSQQLIYDLTP